MPSKGSARRYARAVFEIAQSADAFEKWQEELDVLGQVLGLPEVQSFLGASKVPAERKQALLDEHLKSVGDQARALAVMLVRRGRVHLAPQISQVYQELLDDHRGIVSATVTTAVPMDTDLRGRVEGDIRGRVGGAELRLSSVVDERIIGGIITRIGNQVIDGSTRTRLRNLRDWLHEGAAF
ncbi:MAG: ATP synthase F1 subunit delta [Chloroflexi bacterium]|nr:ATP synthase F1 subunit delta [Chloroflexota bacterium]